MITIDTETTFYPSSSPHHPASKLAYVGILINGDSYQDFPIEYGDHPYQDYLSAINEALSHGDLIIGFNFKFDYAWLLRYGIQQDLDLWDCQIAQYVISHQTLRMPSLDTCLELYDIPKKIDQVREYWDVGIDTMNIPEHILTEYLEGDCRKTFALYNSQIEALSKLPNGRKLYKLIKLLSGDTLITAEMENNGLKYDLEKSKIYQKQLEEELDKLDEKLRLYARGLDINWNSTNDLSAFIYGGNLKKKVREQYTRVLKSGEVKIKEHWVEKVIPLPRLVSPPRNSELAKQGYYSTDQATLRTAYRNASKRGKEIIDLLLHRAKVEKQLSTYFVGIPKLMNEKQWADGWIHGTIHHTTTATGRLSSSAPNQQNLDSEVKKCIVSRWS